MYDPLIISSSVLLFDIFLYTNLFNKYHSKILQTLNLLQFSTAINFGIQRLYCFFKSNKCNIVYQCYSNSNCDSIPTHPNFSVHWTWSRLDGTNATLRNPCVDFSPSNERKNNWTERRWIKVKLGRSCRRETVGFLARVHSKLAQTVYIMQRGIRYICGRVIASSSKVVKLVEPLKLNGF